MKKVLIVDDSISVRKALERILKPKGVEVLSADSAKVALDILEQQNPALIIADIVMPEMDGYEFCALLKQHERLKEIPVLLISGIVNPEVKGKAKDVKAIGIVKKPFKPNTLLYIVSLIFEKLKARATSEQAVAQVDTQAAMTETVSAQNGIVPNSSQPEPVASESSMPEPVASESSMPEPAVSTSDTPEPVMFQSSMSASLPEPMNAVAPVISQAGQPLDPKPLDGIADINSLGSNPIDINPVELNPVERQLAELQFAEPKPEANVLEPAHALDPADALKLLSTENLSNTTDAIAQVDVPPHIPHISQAPQVPQAPQVASGLLPEATKEYNPDLLEAAAQRFFDNVNVDNLWLLDTSTQLKAQLQAQIQAHSLLHLGSERSKIQTDLGQYFDVFYRTARNFAQVTSNSTMSSLLLEYPETCYLLVEVTKELSMVVDFEDISALSMVRYMLRKELPVLVSEIGVDLNEAIIPSLVSV